MRFQKLEHHVSAPGGSHMYPPRSSAAFASSSGVTPRSRPIEEGQTVSRWTRCSTFEPDRASDPVWIESGANLCSDWEWGSGSVQRRSNQQFTWCK